MASVTLSDAAPAPPGAAAFACSRLGFRVFPLRRDTGTPVFTEWPERATTDPDQIKAWWTGEYAGNGVGVATGPESGIWVLDIDVKHGYNGFASLRELCARYGCGTEPFERTMCVRTASGGAHVYFRWDEASGTEGGVRNDSSGKLGEGLDVRGIRGYVRAPGVGAYAIVERGGVKSVRITAAPEWLVPLCKKRRAAPSEAATNADVRAKTGAAGVKWRRFEAAQQVRKLEKSAPGTRNDMLNRTAFNLGRLAGLYGEPSEDAARAWCFGALDSAGANDSSQQRERTFSSGWNAGLAKARETTKVVDHRAVPET